MSDTPTSDTPIRAYHFNNGYLRYGDGREIVEGETLSVEGKPKIGEWGLHGSPDILNALGNVLPITTHLSIVEIWGNVQNDGDLVCGTHRKCLKHISCESILREFRLWCTKQAQHITKDPIKELAMLMAMSSLVDVKLSALRGSVWATAWDAAMTILRAEKTPEARDAAWDKARNAQRAKLLEMLGITE